jgi:predicted phage-related endonuclease
MSEQRSPEWFSERAGCITASRMNDVMAFTIGEGKWKSGPRKGQDKVSMPLKARTDYVLQLAAERLTGKSRKQIKAKALEYGKEMEPFAVAAYEARIGDFIEEAGFIKHPLYEFIGASPDFLIGFVGGGEIKCPESSEVHLETLLTGLPSEHIEQIQGGLWVTGRQWWEFISFHPDFPIESQLYVERIKRDEEYIAKMEIACLSLENEVRAIVRKYLPMEQVA